MKKTAILTLLFTLYLISLLTLASSQVSATTVNVEASALTLSPSVNVQVNHFIEIRDGGLVLIKDTITLSPQSNESADLVNNFLVGFPFEYGKDQVTRERFCPEYCFAFDSQGELKMLSDVGLGRLGFYGANVIFRQAENISNGQSYNFTAVFVFSNLLQTRVVGSPEEVEIEWNMTFPLYPSLIQHASSCLVKVFLPNEASYIPHSSSLYKKTELMGAPKDFNVSTIGSRRILNHTQSPLTEFTSEPGWLIFRQPKDVIYEPFSMLEANEIAREITLDEWGRIFCSEFYRLTNKGVVNVTYMRIRVPQGSYDVSAQDKAGRSLDVFVQAGDATAPTNVTIFFATLFQKDMEFAFKVTYWLPWGNYVKQYNWRDYNLHSLAFFEQQNYDWITRKLMTTITLPEGAEFIQLPTPSENLRSKAYSSLQRNAFQEILTFNFYNVTPSDDLRFNLSYGYLIFWASLRPTLWIGTIVAVVCAVVFLWRLPKRPQVSITPAPSKDLRNFVDAYEKKAGILSELALMEQQLQKGKIPRRKYKVRRETLEGRLSLLSRDLTGLKEKLQRTGPRYASIIGQIEVTETELEGLETDIKRVEGRYRRGEISKGAYLRLLAEYHRRRERARVTIDGVLLRLREEIS